MSTLFDDGKTYKFRHLQNAGLVRDRVDLAAKQKFGFPSGRLLTPRDRQWTGAELNEYYETRPATQEEFAALPDMPAPSKPDMPAPSKVNKAKKLHKKKPVREREARRTEDRVNRIE